MRRGEHVMTSISTVNNAALLILQRANTPAANGQEKSALDKITDIINGVSSEDSAVKTQAAAKINSAYLDVKQTDDIVSHTLDYLDSDLFKASDPDLKDAIKQLVEDESGGLMALVKAERLKNPSITDDNAVANALQGLIREHRDRFMDGEFVLGFGFTGGGSAIVNIEDINGNSTSKSLNDLLSAKRTIMNDAVKAFLSEGQDTSTLTNSQDGRFRDTSDGYFAALNTSVAWMEKWAAEFGFMPSRFAPKAEPVQRQQMNLDALGISLFNRK